MSKVVPSYDEGQLIVAGVRVQAHRDARPPLLEDVAALLAMPADLLRVLVIGLEEHGVLRQITNAFEVRLDIVDHHAAEDLPREQQGQRLNKEVAEFRKAFAAKQDDLKKTFGADAIQKKTDDKMSRLAEELKKFKGQGNAGPFPTMLGSRPPDDDE